MTDKSVVTIEEAASSLKDKVREKIKEQFADLIPDDLWDKLVESELKWFISEPERYGSYSSVSERVSPLKEMIRKELQNMVSAKIKETLDDPKWSSKWVDGHTVVSEAIKEVVTKHATEIVAQVFGSSVQTLVDRIRIG